MRWRSLALVALLLALLLAWLQHRLWRGEAGANQVAALQAQVTRQARDNAGLKQRNETLAAEVVDLKSGEAAVEERARSELGMIRPGETFYRVVDAEAMPEGAIAEPALQAAPLAADDAYPVVAGAAGGAAAAATRAVEPPVTSRPTRPATPP